ncbi:uncharacterized protein LOC123881047 [Maniola jurtina]|uniref:uncharacterized protein LOC123881047 n=1 Tax=Maniola jurtina TaxID=191418 RepID=UPI001E68C584|nr:uncharacterized protein LOC123881047 [Maniola jurtina]
MIRRTPRRRISPRTKRKYRAIKDFVRRAFRTSSQWGTKTSSSIEISVSDLKNKITDIEQQLNNVSKHCQDITCLQNSFRKESQNSLQQVQRDDGSINKQDTDANEVETKLLYNSLDSQHRKSDENHKTVYDNRHDDHTTADMASENQKNTHNIQNFQFKQNSNESRKKRREKNDIDLVDPLRTVPERTRSKYETMTPIYSTSSFQSLVESRNKQYSKPGPSNHRHEKRHSRKEFTEPFVLNDERDRKTVRNLLRNYKRGDDERYKTMRTKRVYSEVDKDFIADIIKRQYRPVKLFGRKNSDFSQFSAPVCRDQDFTERDEIREGIKLCSCCFDECRRKKHRYVRHTDLSDMKGICDKRLYSSKKYRRHKLERVDDYNNSALYDVVPVREKSSPKTRRKFTEDNMIAYQCLKEVPPSPRSHRPRLNLKVQQYADYDDCVYSYNRRRQSRRNSPTREFRKKATNVTESDVSSVSYSQRTRAEILNSAKCQKPVPIHEDVGTLNSFQYSNFANEHLNIPNNDTTLNTQLTDLTADKADKTLCEIKDILKTFLLEIKKESRYSDRSNSTSKIETKQSTQHEGTKTNSNMIPNSGESFNNCGIGQSGLPPYLPAFPNLSCYPILPVCPIHCMQNGYIVPSPSYTCAVCAKSSKEHGCPDKQSSHNNKPLEEVNTNNETQELIKEIYKFVSQKPKSPRTEEYGNEDSARSKNERLFDRKILSNKYVGGSNKASKHDANVGTPHLKYYSKSYEAIRSKTPSDKYNTNASYSDTILEKLNLEATQSSTENDSSTDVPEEKVKRGKLRKVFNPWRLFRKKKKDLIEEMSESGSTVPVEVKPKPPFKQRIQSYAMHSQEYYHPPPIPHPHCCSPRYDCCHYEPRTNYQPPSPPDFCNYSPHQHDHAPAPHYHPKYPTAPPYPNYNQIPQVPLCLKEIEVKSIGTQSERKVSIFQKLAKKIPTAVQQPAQEAFRHNAPVKEKSNFWKSLQENAKQADNDTKNFSLKMQMQLAQGDVNMKNAMMKKLFYKRNPFSPKNLIVRTLLGKDKSSYGKPPKMYRPRMFI